MKSARAFQTSGSKRTLTITALFIALSAPGLHLCAQDIPTQRRAVRQQQIEGLSEVERSRLQRNFAEFKKLPEAEREKLRQLDRDLKEDDRSGGKLRKLMEEYCDWLGTIEIWQREELRNITDPKEREMLVRTIRKEQESSTRPEIYGPGRGMNPRWAGLNRKDLDSVMKALEQGLQEHVLSVHEQEELNKRQDLARYAFLLEQLVKNELPAVREAFERKQPFQPRLPAAAIDSLVASISNEKQQKLLGPPMPPGERLRHLTRLIWVGLRTEYGRMKPTDKQLEEYFVTLKGAKQDELMRLPTELMQQRLAWLYMQEHPEKYPPLPREVWGLFPRDGFDGESRRKQFGPGEPGERRGPPGGFRGDKGGPPPRKDKAGEKQPSA